MADMNERDYDRAVPRTYTVSRVSWGAVFAGAVITVIVQVMLVFLGIAIGLFALDFGGEGSALSGFGVGTYLWWVVSAIIALFVGGWVTSRFAGLQRKFDGVLHGVLTWAVTTILAMVLLTNMVGGIVGGAFSVFGSVASAAGQAVSAAAPEVAQAVGIGDQPIQSLLSEAQQVIQQVRERGGDDAVQELTTAVREVFRDPEITQAERQRIVGLITEYTDISEQEASRRVDSWQSVYQDARQAIAGAGSEDRLGAEEEGVSGVARTATNITEALASAALWSFITILLTAIAAGIGGSIGRVKGQVSV